MKLLPLACRLNEPILNRNETSNIFTYLLIFFIYPHKCEPTLQMENIWFSNGIFDALPYYLSHTYTHQFLLSSLIDWLHFPVAKSFVWIWNWFATPFVTFCFWRTFFFVAPLLDVSSFKSRIKRKKTQRQNKRLFNGSIIPSKRYWLC